MNRLFQYTAFLVFLLIPLSGHAKKIKLSYGIKENQSVNYTIKLEKQNTFIIQGIGEKNSINFLMETLLTPVKKSSEGYVMQLRLTKLTTEFYSRDQLVNRIESDINTIDAAQLRRMINQNILFELTTTGNLTVKNGLESIIEELNLDNSTKGALLNAFSKNALSELLHLLFPVYPDKKLEQNTNWSNGITHFGILNLELNTNYIITGIDTSVSIKSADYIENQPTKLNISGSEVSTFIMGSSDVNYSVDPKTGMVLDCNGSLKLISEDKTAELISTFTIAQ